VQSPKKTVTVKDTLRGKAGLAVEPRANATVDQRAIDDGRKPLAARRADIAALRAKATEVYGVPASGLPIIPAIESQFQFAAREWDADFNHRHAQSLLDQAAALLERCAVARSEHDRLHLEKWKLHVELDRSLRLEQIQERELQAGVHTLPYERAAVESAAENSLETNYGNAEAVLKELTEDLVSSGLNQRMTARELSAWVNAYPLKDADLRGDDANYSFDGTRRTKPEHLFEAARMEAEEAAREQVHDLAARRCAAMAASDAGRFRRQSLDLQTKWSLAEIGFRQEKLQVERDALWEKVFQAQSPGGLFNYTERIEPLKRHFSNDFREALATLAAAQRGLKDLYDYAPQFPQPGAPGYFDEVMVWVRNAQTRIAQFSHMDQNYVLAVSVKDLAKSQWATGLSSSQWTFDVPDELFEGQAHVRLRGLGLAVVGEPEVPKKPGPEPKAPPPPAPPKPTGFWWARLSLPPTATVRHLSGTAVELDQKSLPVCYLGRVADRDSFREPETAGGDALHNASPIGKQWKLTLAPKSTDGIPTTSLRDVQLYLHVAVHSMKARS